MVPSFRGNTAINPIPNACMYSRIWYTTSVRTLRKNYYELVNSLLLGLPFYRSFKSIMDTRLPLLCLNGV